MPRQRITLNLAPADVYKHGSAFDLPMALAILVSSQQIPPTSLSSTVIVGELSLTGDIRPVKGVIFALEAAQKAGFKTVIIPSGNAEQAKLVNNIEVIPAKNLKELFLHLTSEQPIQSIKNYNTKLESPVKPAVDLVDIASQSQAKRALEIAAAGRHNLLLTGPPGTGKSMLAKAFVGILPPMQAEEIIEITKLYSLQQEIASVISQRPLRQPHHTASHISIVGGGSDALPGEISLAHRGVLFLDEIPEYRRETLESLRQPLEDRQISLSRSKVKTTYPADFILLATQNPCPCGFYGDPNKECICPANKIINYRQKLSGPLLDRIDLVAEMSRIKSNIILSSSGQQRETSKSVRQRVVAARNIQIKRYGTSLKTNSSLNNKEINRYAHLTSEAKQLLDQSADSLHLSPRSYLRAIKTARTIADLQASDKILPEHIAETLQYRIGAAD